MQFLNSVVLCIALGLAACEAQDVMTPQQQEDARQSEERIKAHDKELSEKGKIADELMAEIVAKIGRNESVASEIAQFKSLTDEYDALLKQRDEEIEALNKKYSDAVEERTGGITNVVRAIPVVGPYAEWLALAVPFLFRRPRQLAGDGLKYAGKGQLWQAFLALPKILGLLHTSGDPEEIARNAAWVAKRDNRPELAMKIQQAVS